MSTTKEVNDISFIGYCNNYNFIKKMKILNQKDFFQGNVDIVLDKKVTGDRIISNPEDLFNTKNYNTNPNPTVQENTPVASLNFDRLKNEYNSFWNSKNINDAIKSYSKINSFFGNDLFLTKSEYIFTPENQTAFYSNYHNISVKSVTEKISYSEMIRSFREQLNSFISEIKENQKRLDALNEKSFLDNLLSSAVDVVKFTIPIILLLIFIFFYITK